MIPYYFGTPHVAADTFWPYTYAFQWGRQILWKAWLCWIMTGANSPARVPQICTEWISSEQHQQLRHILVGKVCQSQSTNLSSFSHSTAFIDWYVFCPRHLRMEEWEGHPTRSGCRTNQEVALSSVPLCKHHCKGQLAHCQERVSMDDFCVCLEYVLESAEERVGFLSESFQPKGAIQKNVSCALESGCFHGWLVPEWLVSVVGAQKVNLCFWADQFHSQFLIYNPWSYDTSLYPAPSPT